MKSRFGKYPKNLADLSDCYLNYLSNIKFLRFGQWMFITYVNDGEPWPELFYEDITWKSYMMINLHLEKSEEDNEN